MGRDDPVLAEQSGDLFNAVTFLLFGSFGPRGLRPSCSCCTWWSRPSSRRGHDGVARCLILAITIAVDSMVSP